MATDVLLHVLDRTADVTRDLAKEYSRRSYTSFFQASVSLEPSTPTEIVVPFNTIEMIAIGVVTDNVTLRIYKNDEAVYWETSAMFLIADTDASKLELWADAAAEVTVAVGGQ